MSRYLYINCPHCDVCFMKGRRLKVHNLTTAAHGKIQHLRCDLSVGNIGTTGLSEYHASDY